MANVTARMPTFSRGSTVLDYWLAHAEGMTVQPLGARVEEVVVTPQVGHAETLIVRSRVTRRRRSIPAAAIAAVEPSAGEFLLDMPDHGSRARSILSWLHPHVVRLGRASSEAGRVGAARTSQGAAWLAPRARVLARTAFAAAVRWTLAAAVIVARGIARAGRGIGNGAAATADRARESLESRRER